LGAIVGGCLQDLWAGLKNGETEKERSEATTVRGKDEPVGISSNYKSVVKKGQIGNQVCRSSRYDSVGTSHKVKNPYL